MRSEPDDRRRRRKAFLLGAGSMLAAELMVAGVLLVPSPSVVAGIGAPVPPATAAAEPSRTEPPDHPPTPESPTGQPTRSRTPERTPAPEPAAEANKPATAPSGQRPGTVRLPDGGTATLVRQELADDAVLPIPENLDEATWWGAGLDAPSGASVFAGHVNWQGRTGPFAELWDSRVGDDVTVKDREGATWSYGITQIITLGKDELPARASELFGQSGHHRLVLVTCGGRWLGGTTGYAENRVVIAEPR